MVTVGHRHTCPTTGRTQVANDDSGDFLTSAVVGYVTDSTLVGAVVGGDLLGAVVGDALNDDDSVGSSDD